MISRLMKLLCLVLVLALQACAAPEPIDPSLPMQIRPGKAPIPGDYWRYSFGPGQTKANFENVERAQYDYALWSERQWRTMGPGSGATANLLGLQVYYPLYVRWKLKDGRAFTADVDVAAVMREYFKTHSLQLQWQREGRPKAKVGDAEPLLAHEVKNDSVILKWVIQFNLTPVKDRLTSTGAATQWDFHDEEHIVAILKGIPVSDIDFSKK